MKKLLLFFILLAFCQTGIGQQCNCSEEFQWMKRTFEENDAGFRYVVDNKGKQLYDGLNSATLAKVKNVTTAGECQSLLREWLQFFRKGHIDVSISDSVQKIMNAIQAKKPAPVPSAEIINRHEKVQLTEQAWEAHLAKLDKLKDPGFEGLWSSPPYTVGIIKVNEIYKGFVIEAPGTSWQRNHVKLKIYPTDNGFKGTIYFRDFSGRDSVAVENPFGINYLSVGPFSLKRLKPVYEDEEAVKNYLSILTTPGPQVRKINTNTVYLRIPSFNHSQKRKIDSVVQANHQLITSTPNLIIDVRNNGGGSDDSYTAIIPYLYTNPIRTVHVGFYSTLHNNKAMLDLAADTTFTVLQRKEFRENYDVLSKSLGKFVVLGDKRISVDSLAHVHPYPQQVGILVNNYCGSTTEQFLLAVKQSKKVKLFGTRTFGSLDFSNMYSARSPSGVFQLHYCLSKSFRIPDFMIDNVGIQPDYYIDSSIPDYQWIGFASGILAGK